MSNPSREKPTTIELALKHTKNGDPVTPGTSSATSGADNADSTASAGAHPDKPHCYGFIPPYMLKDLSERNPTNRSFQRTMERMETLVREAPIDRATTVGGNSEREVYDAKGQEVPGVRARFEGDPATGKFETDTVYDFTGEVRAFYKELFGRDSIDGKGMKFVSTENYGQNFENAFWNGSQMTYGYPSADSPFATFVLIDVCGHEITHGVTENSQMFEYSGQSGALNESLSDVFGELIKQRTNKTPVEQADWAVGIGCWKQTIHGHGIRNMLHPGTAYDDPRIGKDLQPAHMKDYVKTNMDGGGVHIDSGIPNRAFALFAIDVGGNAWEEPAKIWFAARAESEHHPSFAQFAYHTIEAAKKLDFEDDVSKLEKAWEEVGVTPSASEADESIPDHS